MFGSPAMSNDLNLPFPSSPFKHHHQHHTQPGANGNGHGNSNKQDDNEHLHRQQQHHMSSSLLRYRSAPPTAVLGGPDAAEEFLRAGPPPPAGTEAESMFARFMAPPDHPMGEKQHHHHAPPAVSMGEPGHHPHMLFQLHNHHHHPQQPPPPPPSLQGLGGQPEVGAFRVMTSAGMDHDDHGASGEKGGAGGGPGLVRHSSSPAGLTPQLNVENGFAAMRVGTGGGGFRSGANGSDRLKTQISFSSRGQQGSSFLSQISELGPGGGDGSSDEGGGGGGGGERGYMQGFPVATWEDSVLLSESFKRVRDPSELQNGVSVSLAMGGGGGGSGGAGPVRSLSGDVERYLQFQDAVPCKVRAKRGCATHPRSIAERVRRTRISERIRKLQELVPNMDKQTNTADMLDLAVEYIKDLQRQAKALSENRANCTCGANGRHQ